MIKSVLGKFILSAIIAYPALAVSEVAQYQKCSGNYPYTQCSKTMDKTDCEKAVKSCQHEKGQVKPWLCGTCSVMKIESSHKKMAELASSVTGVRKVDATKKINRIQDKFCEVKYAFLLNPNDKTADNFMKYTFKLIDKSKRVSEYLKKAELSISHKKTLSKSMMLSNEKQEDNTLNIFKAKCPDMVDR
jgi:hypothetical protein